MSSNSLMRRLKSHSVYRSLGAKLNLHLFLPESLGFQSRRCRCWRAQSWGWSSSSHCSWTRVTGRVRGAVRASTSWSMSLRSEPKSSWLTLMHMGSKSSQWMTEESNYWEINVVFSMMSWWRMFFLHTAAQFIIAGCHRPISDKFIWTIYNFVI